MWCGRDLVSGEKNLPIEFLSLGGEFAVEFAFESVDIVLSGLQTTTGAGNAIVFACEISMTKAQEEREERGTRTACETSSRCEGGGRVDGCACEREEHPRQS